MSLLNYLKSAAIQATDFYSLQTLPWQKFDRPALPKTLRTLKERNAEVWADLQSFLFFDELIVNRIPQDRVPPLLDTGDQATWQGIAAMAVAYNYAHAKSDELARVLQKLLDGMYQHQHFHGEKNGRLIRGYDRRDNNRWQDDASNDSATGHFAGLYAILRWGPIELKGRALQLLSSLASELIENNFCLINANGKPTTYGKLINGAFTEPLSMTLCLAILSVAEHYGLHGLAGKARDEVYSKYGDLVPYPKFMPGTKENWNDDHRAAIHLAILALEDRSPRMQDLTRRGLLRLWSLLQNRANIWVNGLIALGLGENRPHDLETEMRRQAKLVLSEYELEDKRWDTETDWSGALPDGTYRGKMITSCEGVSWCPHILVVNGTPRARQPIPHWCDSKQDFIYQRNRYSVRDWMGATGPSQRFNGLDFFAAYHANLLAGILTEND